MDNQKNEPLMETLKKSRIAPLLFFSFRLYMAFKRSLESSFQYFKIAFTSREIHTFTYKLTKENKFHLTLLTAKLTGQGIDTISRYMDEIEQNEALCKAMSTKIKNSHFRFKKDRSCEFACRAAFYAIIRAKKCKVVVENGMEMGISSAVFCSALAKNREEGYPGIYYGFDIDPNAGLLLKDPLFENIAHPIIGDGMKSLSQIEEPIDFYFSDGYRTYEYEKNEFELLFDKLSDQAIVISNKAIFSTALAELAVEKQKQFTFFQEQPSNHWYQGWGLGIMTMQNI